MTAAEILASYRAAQPALKRPIAWLSLLEIAAAGPKGIKYQDLLHTLDRSDLGAAMVKRWTAAGLVEVERLPLPPGRGGHKPKLMRATPKTYAFLRITPPNP